MTLVYAQTDPARVWVALAEEGGAYAEAAAVLKGELSDDVTLTISKWQTLLEAGTTQPDLIVTVGTAALEGVESVLVLRGKDWSEVPLLATLLPLTAFDAKLGQGDATGRKVTAAVLDQPLRRQIALIRRAMPEHRRIGVLLGPQSRSLLGELNKVVVEQSSKLTAIAVNAPSESLYPGLRALLEESDVILALPDPAIYNSANLQNILLTTYRARTPLVAFSPAYVKAGAVLAVYSTPAQIARQAAKMIRGWQAKRSLPPVQMPDEFTVTVNAKVAASLGLTLDDASKLAEDLRRQEAR